MTTANWDSEVGPSCLGMESLLPGQIFHTGGFT